jgi:hypothetical protein
MCPRIVPCRPSACQQPATATLRSMQRINVVGTSCSGKTTLSRAVAETLALPYVELDALFWGPSWTPVPTAEFRARVARALDRESWVVDGGYSPVRGLIWERVDTVVWLDFPMRTVLRRWARRTVVRLVSRHEFWPGTGNRERVAHLAGRDSLLWWIVRTHRSRRGGWQHSWMPVPTSRSSASARPPSRRRGSGRWVDRQAPGRFHSLPSAKRSRFQIGSRSLIASMT